MGGIEISRKKTTQFIILSRAIHGYLFKTGFYMRENFSLPPFPKSTYILPGQHICNVNS